MPKVYLDSAERQNAKINRELSSMAKGQQSNLAKLWGISQQAVSKRLNTGNVTLIDLWKARHIFDADEIADLIKGR